jgi:hypothetical protein
MNDRWTVVVAAGIALALPLGGCRDVRRDDSWPVGTCVRASDESTTPVSCAEPHTHRVTAIVAGDGEACPADTVMYASPADQHDGAMTTCFQAHTVLLPGDAPAE